VVVGNELSCMPDRMSYKSPSCANEIRLSAQLLCSAKVGRIVIICDGCRLSQKSGGCTGTGTLVDLVSFECTRSNCGEWLLTDETGCGSGYCTSVAEPWSGGVVSSYLSLSTSFLTYGCLH